jgi:hypothetical protein
MKLAKISWLSSLRSHGVLDCTLWYGTLVFNTTSTEIVLKKYNYYWSIKARLLEVTSPPASFLLPQIKDCLGLNPIHGESWVAIYGTGYCIHFFAILKPCCHSGQGKVKDTIHS